MELIEKCFLTKGQRCHASL